MFVCWRYKAVRFGKALLSAQLIGRVPVKEVTLKFMVCRAGKAEGWAQLLGREPVKPDMEKFMVCRVGKLPLPAQESGKPGRLPVRVRFVSDCRQPRDRQVSREQLDGRLVSME